MARHNAELPVVVGPVVTRGQNNVVEKFRITTCTIGKPHIRSREFAVDHAGILS